MATLHSAGYPTFGTGQANNEYTTIGVRYLRLVLIQSIQAIHSVVQKSYTKNKKRRCYVQASLEPSSIGCNPSPPIGGHTDADQAVTPKPSHVLVISGESNMAHRG